MFGTQITEAKIWKSKKQRLLDTEIDRTLNFDKYSASLCRKGEKKLSV